jgi:hypothetical protein
LKTVVWRWLLCAAALVPQLLAQTKAPAPSSDQLIGAWRLVSIETIRPTGEVIYPYYGKHPRGLIMYDRGGWMSVQIISDPAPTVPSTSSRESVLSASLADKSKAFDGYYAYYGTWTFDAAASTVTHHVQQSLTPGERGEDAVRHFVLDGDRLILTAKTHEMGEDHERKLVWQRVASPQP